MKKPIYVFLTLCLLLATFGIFQGQSTSAIAEFDSEDKGLLVPRMTSTQRANIMNPSEGLMVYDLTEHTFFFHNGSQWRPMDASHGSSLILGEIRLIAGDSIPSGWSACDGNVLNIADKPLLFAAIGNAFGGDGITTFALPDLQGRVAMGAGEGSLLTARNIGDEIGNETHILDVTQIPSHNHTLRATNSSATQTQAAGNILATAATPQYLNASTSVVMGSDAIGYSGSNAPFALIQPSTVINFIIYTG